MKQIPRHDDAANQDEVKKFRSDSETMGAVVSILNNPTSKFQNIPSVEEQDHPDDDNLLLLPSSAEFQSEKNRFDTREEEQGYFQYPFP